jgi:hypothetical protein
MKNTLTIILSGLLLCGCSQKQTTSAPRAIDRVEAGKDVPWARGVVLHIAKRDGTTVEGVQLQLPRSDGQIGTITAETGSLAPGSDISSTDDSCVRITLHNPKGVDTNEVTFVLHER